MARLSSADRKGLSDRAFAYVDSRGRRLLPIHDEPHVRNALARFGQVRFEDETARDQARRRLLQAAKRHRIVPVGFIASELDVVKRTTAGDDLPTGFVTMLMTDVEGSTALVQQLGGRFGLLIDEVWSVLRAAVLDHRGVEVEARADELFAVFEAPLAAVDAAVEVQRTLGRRSFVDDVHVRVRIGIHSGYPTRTVGNYVGLDVNTTARITALGHGGQIVASPSTREAVSGGTSGAVRFVSLGPHRLRGLSAPMPLFQIGASGLRSTFPPLRTELAPNSGPPPAHRRRRAT